MLCDKGLLRCVRASMHFDGNCCCRYTGQSLLRRPLFDEHFIATLTGVHGFSVVTRVSRNGSALTSHFVRVYNTLRSHRVRTRILSSVSVRHRHNVAVGTRSIALCCSRPGNRHCRLGFVSAPNRISFSCRISHSLTTYRNTLLIMSTTRNIRTRSITGYCATISRLISLLLHGAAICDLRIRRRNILRVEVRRGLTGHLRQCTASGGN